MTWRVERIGGFGWDADRWAVRRFDEGGNVVERLMRDGKERTFLRVNRANAEADKMANAKPPKVKLKDTKRKVYVTPSEMKELEDKKEEQCQTN